ncbi:MAG: HAD family hydrolase [Chloroflexia bacterium]|nr:HAD family hydrolase [Chloroflexia bacterium]
MNTAKRQTLLIDADDTLWENNIYFEQAIAQFIEHAAPSMLPADEIRRRLDEEERRMLTLHGYGSRTLSMALQRTWQAVIPEGHVAPSLADIERLALAILDLEIEILPGVADTLVNLAGDHDLYLVTKGNLAEQQAKIDRSGIADKFLAAIVVDDKTVDTYHDTVHQHRLDPAMTWMIGNSIRSDINPAIGAGLRAIFVPHPDTWHMEHEELADPDGICITVDRFDQIPGVINGHPFEAT